MKEEGRGENFRYLRIAFLALLNNISAKKVTFLSQRVRTKNSEMVQILALNPLNPQMMVYFQYTSIPGLFGDCF